MKLNKNLPMLELLQKKLIHLNIRKISDKVWAIFRNLLMIGLGFILVYPLIYMVSIAFRPTSQVMDPSIVWIPRNLTLENFPTVLGVMNYPEPLINTVTVGFVSAVFQIVICAIIGYGFARFKFKEKNILFALVLFTIVVPQQTMTIPTYLQFRNFDFFGIIKLLSLITGGPDSINLLGSRMVFYLPSMLGMGLRSGLFIFVYRQFFRGMPLELEESAMIDGCGPFRTFLKVMLPNAKPVLLTVFLFSVVWHWNDYFYSIMYLGNIRTVATALANLRVSLEAISEINIYDPYELVTRLQTGALISIIPMLVLYIAAQRYFTESIERSGIVG